MDRGEWRTSEKRGWCFVTGDRDLAFEDPKKTEQNLESGRCVFGFPGLVSRTEHYEVVYTTRELIARATLFSMQRESWGALGVYHWTQVRVPG